MAIVYNIDRPRTINAEAIVDSQNYRITLDIVGWVIIQTVWFDCCLKSGVPVYMYLGGVMI